MDIGAYKSTKEDLPYGNNIEWSFTIVVAMNRLIFITERNASWNLKIKWVFMVDIIIKQIK